MPEAQRAKARNLGLLLALVARIVLLFGVTWLQKLTTPIVLGLSARDLVLVTGGLFLLVKAVKEIHHVVEMHHGGGAAGGAMTFSDAVLQILLLDIVFSLDSVVTAVGLTSHLEIIVGAVLISFTGLLFFAGPIAEFVIKRPTLKILALSFLVCIGATLTMEGFHQEVPKAYLYLPMAFALVVELLQLRFEANKGRVG